MSTLLPTPTQPDHLHLASLDGSGRTVIALSRTIIRTPSPTPSEVEALGGKKKKKEWTWKSTLNLGIFLLIIAIITLLIIYHDKIVDALKPAANWMKRTPGGWLIPIAFLIILSFPPLIGHDIVLFVVGFTWGLGVGFGIAAAGTFFGELITFYFFKFICKGREDKIQDNLGLALYARVLRDGGWKVVTAARYGSTPPHLLTALLSMCGLDVVTFCIAAILSLPRQLVGVYLGYALIGSPNGKTTKTALIVQYVFIGVTIAVSYIAMYYIGKKQKLIAPEIVYQRRKRRQARLQEEEDARVAVGGHPKPDLESGIVAPIPRRPQTEPKVENL